MLRRVKVHEGRGTAKLGAQRTGARRGDDEAIVPKCLRGCLGAGVKGRVTEGGPGLVGK